MSEKTPSKRTGARKLAKERGDKHYVSNAPCKYGNIAPRQTSNSNCSCEPCAKEHYEKSTKYRVGQEAKARRKTYAAKYYQDNAEKVKAAVSAYSSSNEGKAVRRIRYHRKSQDPEWRTKTMAAIAAYKRTQKGMMAAKLYRAKNRERLKAKARENYYLADNLRRRYARNRYPEVKAARNAWFKTRYHSDTEFRAGILMRVMLRRVILLAGVKKNVKTFGLLGYHPSEFHSHLASLFEDGMSWDNYGDQWEVDHVVPVSELMRCGITCPKIINALSNLRPLWREKNRSKGQKFELGVKISGKVHGKKGVSVQSIHG